MQQRSHIYIPLSPQLQHTHYNIQYPVYSFMHFHSPSSLCIFPFSSFAIIYLHLLSSTFIYSHLLPFTIIFYLHLLSSTFLLLKNDFYYHLLLPIITPLLLPPFTCTIINLLPYPLTIIYLMFIKIIKNNLLRDSRRVSGATQIAQRATMTGNLPLSGTVFCTFIYIHPITMHLLVQSNLDYPELNPDNQSVLIIQTS